MPGHADGLLSLHELSKYYERLCASLERPHSVPESRTQIVNSVRMRYLEWNRSRPGSPSTVLLHGGGLNAHTWDSVATLLAEDYHVVAVDLRGHGASEWSPGGHYTLYDYSEDVSELLHAIDLRDYVLVGMSLGGFVCLKMITTMSAKPQAQILVDVSTTVDKDAAESNRHFMVMQQDFADFQEALAYVAGHSRMTSKERKEMLEDAAARRTVPGLPAHVALNLMLKSDGRVTWRYDRRYRTASELTRLLSEAAELDHFLNFVECATVLVVGGRSDVVPAGEPERLRGQLGGQFKTVVVPEVGHSVQRESPRALANVIQDAHRDCGL